MFASSRPSANISCIFRKRISSTIYKNYSEIRKNWSTSDCHWISRKTMAFCSGYKRGRWTCTCLKLDTLIPYPHWSTVKLSSLYRNWNKFINQIKAPGRAYTNNNYDWYDTQQQYIKLNIRGELSIIVVQAHSGRKRDICT